MAKGAGSSGDLFSGVELLEGRLLLSYAAGSHAVHALAATPVQVAAATSAPRTDSETSRPDAASADLEVREAEDLAASVAAASSDSKPGYTIPLVTLGGSLDRSDPTQASQTISDTSRILLKSDHDDPVAWGVRNGGSTGLVGMARHRADSSPEVPETVIQEARETRLSLLSARPAASEGVPGLAPSRGSDLLADFLPSDQPALERAIDRLLDGFEGLGSDIARGVETTGLVPSPIAWAVTLAALELARRRLRRLLAEDEDGLDPDRDPAVGLLGFVA